jgi:hypothetical protein
MQNAYEVVEDHRYTILEKRLQYPHYLTNNEGSGVIEGIMGILLDVMSGRELIIILATSV